MVVLGDNDIKTKTASKEEIDEALNKIFSEMNKVLAQKDPTEITRDKVNETLDALFQAVNESKYKGKKTKIPDFKRIIEDEF